MGIEFIQSEVAFIGNETKKVAKSSVHDYTITKTFKVNLNPPKAPKIVEVIWSLPSNGWLKCNTSNSFAISKAYEIFCNGLGDFIFAFSKMEGKLAFRAELFRCG